MGLMIPAQDPERANESGDRETIGMQFRMSHYETRDRRAQAGPDVGAEARNLLRDM